MYAMLRGYEASGVWRTGRSNAMKTYLRADPCAYCGQYRPRMSWDHIEPRLRGHTMYGNMVRACVRCNKVKDARPLLRWLVHRAWSDYRRQRRNAA